MLNFRVRIQTKELWLLWVPDRVESGVGALGVSPLFLLSASFPGPFGT